MIFSSLEFFVFFSVLIGILLLARSQGFKKIILLGASYFFYGYWDERFVFLLAALTIVNYAIGFQIESTQNPEKKRWLIAGITFNLIVLGFFKYFNFFIDSLNLGLNVLNLNLSNLRIILPIGISFITFEVISYLADIYRGTSRPAKTFWDFALLVAFFPHLISGPILRSSQFLGEIEKGIHLNRENFSQGAQLFLLGLVRKVIVADRLALFVNEVFKQPADYSAMTLWFAVIGYAIQLYCDFCGYSDMAIGTAKILGFDIPKNFATPYLSRSITEFWRRWHISLSNWLRDYLYIPLGGDRRGKVQQYGNLMIVMLLGGLWHGASWNFVVWGGLHGGALVVHKLYADRIPKSSVTQAWDYQLCANFVTLLFVCLTWIFFRSSDFSTSLFILQKLWGVIDPTGINWFATALAIAVPMFILTDYAGHQLAQGMRLRLSSLPGLCAFFFVMFGVLFLAPAQPAPFIYFQF